MATQLCAGEMGFVLRRVVRSAYVRLTRLLSVGLSVDMDSI